MKRSAKIRLGVFAVALPLCLMGLWARADSRSASAAQELEYAYRRALNDLTEHVSHLESTLQKAPYVGTGVTQGSVSAGLLEQSGGAKAAMAVLPLSQEHTEKISRFLSQTGDFALALSRNASAGDPLSEEEAGSLKSLETYAEKLLSALEDAQAKLSAESGNIYRVKDSLENLEGLKDLAPLDDSFDAVSKEFDGAPALLYDGPFSDHLTRREALYLKDREAVSEEEAKARAADFLGCAPEDLEALGSGGQEIAVFSFRQGESRVNISKAGGEVVYFKKEAEVRKANLNYEEALEKAKAFLETLGVGPVKETYYSVSDRLCTVNFAGVSETDAGENVVCYPDLIKVTVELKEGGTVEYDGAGYLMNCHERALSAPTLSPEAAAESVSGRLRPLQWRLTVIPTPGLSELLAWEFLCESDDGGRFLSYINCETGLEEQLYRLEISENGVLAS